jgi:putative transposase
MKQSRFTEEQIVAILKQSDAGMKTAEVCRQNGVSEATFYKWKAKYGGLGTKRRTEVEATGRGEQQAEGDCG